MDEDEMKISLKVSGGDLKRSGVQPGSHRMEMQQSTGISLTTSISDSSERTVIVECVPESHQEALENYLESHKKGGGRLDSFERESGNANNMVAVFAHRNAAENMLRLGNVQIVGVTMKMSSPTQMFSFKDGRTPVYSSQGALKQTSFDRLRDIQPGLRSVADSLASDFSSMGVSISDVTTRTVVIKGVPETHIHGLKDFLLNPENGGGRLLSFERDPRNPRNVVAVFAHRKAAETILGRRTITVVGLTMDVCQRGSRDDNDSNQGAASDTVKVSSIPLSVTEETLVLYFELKKRSGGGPIKRMQMKPEKRQALITFQNANDAAQVAKREIHQLADGYVDVLLLESDLAAGSGSCRAIGVSGIDWHKLGADLVSMYFENEGRSGGAEITELFVDQDVAVITFATPQVVQRVLSKKKHVLDGVQLQVEALTPRSPPPVFAGETEKNRLIVKGLPFGITLEKLSKFVEKDAGCRVTGWVLGAKKNSAMLEFDGEPDYAALRRLVNSMPFSGQMIGVQRVPLARCLQVDGLSEKDSTKDITTYFEKETGSVHGTIRSERKSETSVVLQFPLHSVMVPILSQQHVLKGETLKLSPYSKELGCVLPEKASKDPPDNWIPRSTKVVGIHEQLQVAQNNLLIREYMEQTLHEANCVVTWPSNTELDVKLQQITRRGSSEYDQEWPELCTGVFQSLLGDIVTRKLDITAEVWRRLKTRVEGQTSEVVVDFNVESSKLCLAGFRDHVEKFEKKLKPLKEEVEKQLEEEEEMKRRKVEVLSSLRQPHIRYLERCGFADEMTKLFPKLKLTMDEKEVKLEGTDETLVEAKIFIYDIINRIEARFIELSEDLTELIATEPTKTYVSDYLKQYGIKAIVQVEKNGVTVHAMDQEEIRKASVFIMTDFVSEKLDLNDAARHVMQSPDWQQLVENLKKDYRFFRLDSRSDALVVSGRKDLVAGIVRKIQEVFQKHVPIEHFFSMKYSNAQLVGTFRKSEIDTMGTKLRASAMGGTLKQVLTPGDVSGFALKGNSEEVEAAKKQLEVLTKSFTESTQEISRPGVISVIEKSEWKEFLKILQANHSVILKTSISNPYTPSPSPNVKYGPLYEMTINGHSIVVVFGDITDVENGGALINPANPRLEQTHGLGLEIVKSGDTEIEEECQNHIKNSGTLPPGTIFVSKAGSLPYDIIIHVVEPTTFDDQSGHVYQLAIKMALEEALRNDVEFVAFPLTFGATFKRQLLFATIKEFFEKPESLRLKTVQFVDNDAKELEKLERQLKDFENSVTSTGSPSSPSPVLSSPTQLTHTTPEDVVIKFHKGNICTLQADAIVNSTSKVLELGNGGVSKAIVFTAGPQIQKECKEKAPNGLSQYGDILATKAYNLGCKVVYHGAAVQWDNGAGPCEKVLRTFVSGALTEAHKQNLTSIAIPAIGSGTLKIPHDVVVNVLLDEIFKFSKTHPGTSLRTIYTVAYEQNQPSVAAFEKKFLELQQKAQRTTAIKTQVNFSQARGLRAYDEKLTILINALSQSAVQLVQSETTKFINDASDKRSLEIMKSLTDEQLDRIDLVQVVHMVRIALSNGRIDIQGLKDDVTTAVEKIKYILKDI